METGRILKRQTLWIALIIPLALLLVVISAMSPSRSHAVAQPTAGELEVSKQVNAAQAGPGDTLTYTIHVRDTGGAPTPGAWLTDTLAGELTFVPGSLTASYGTFGFASGVITWTGDLGDAWITFTAEISPDISPTTIVNTAEVTGAGELVTSNPASTAVSPGHLEAIKTAASPSVRPGERLTYTVRVTNTGAFPVEAASMSDELPLEVNYAGGLNATLGNWGVAGNTITWTGALPPSGTALITFAVQLASSVNERVSFTNTAVLTGAGSLVQASVSATAVTTFHVNFPIISRRYPPVPILNSIPLPDASGAYVVSWSCDVTGTDRYVLQESTDANFANVTRVFTTTSTSQLVQQASSYGCTLYYRVRVDDDSRWGQGPWSNVQSVTPCYFDDFSNAGSGWPSFDVLVIQSSNTHYHGRYENGQYRILVDAGGPEIWFHQPQAYAPYRPPTDRFCVEADVKFMRNQPPWVGWNFYPYWANGGIIFGAGEDNKNLYIMCLAVGAENPADHSAVMGWYLMHNPANQWAYEGCHSQDSLGGETGGLNAENWYHLAIGVNGDQVTAYINGVNKGTWTMGGLAGTTRVGVTGGPYEVTPVDLRFDNFRVRPNASCTP